MRGECEGRRRGREGRGKGGRRRGRKEEERVGRE